MADEFNTSTNWWDSSRNRFDSGSSSSSSGLTNSFGWPSEMVDVKLGRSSMESASVSDTSSIVFHDNTHKLQLQQQQQQQHPQPQDSSSTDLHMMGLGLSSQSIDWNQAALLRGDSKTDQGSFRSMLQENLNYRGFSLDQSLHFSPHHHGGGGSSSDSSVTCQGGLQSSSYQMDSSVMYGSPSSMLQGLLGSDNNQYGTANYGNISSNNTELVPSSWSNKVVPNFLRNSPPKQTTAHNNNNNNSQLHFSNNAPFWNASATSINDVRPTFFSSMQPQFPASNFEEKPPKQNISEVVRDSSSTIVKKSGSETATKRPRNETPTPVPAFKVRKEKMGDRITALQQLVSPFGKTDTASVLSEAIEYIKFLHEQVSVLSTPYMKSNGAPIHHQQNSDKSSKDPDGQKQDLRSRGLCLVPVSSTFPVNHETAVDFWTPTFGGTYR